MRCLMQAVTYQAVVGWQATDPTVLEILTGRIVRGRGVDGLVVGSMIVVTERAEIYSRYRARGQWALSPTSPDRSL